MGSRTWIKIYCDKWLTGTIREETPDLRGIWVDLLTLAGSSVFGDTGEIKLIQNTGLKDDQLAQMLGITAEDWTKYKTRLIETERITVSDCNIITICNWNKYQSEYQRQKPLRKVTSESYIPKLQSKVGQKVRGDRDRDRDTSLTSLKEKTKNPLLEKFVETFVSTCPNLKNISTLTKSRKTKILNRLKEHPDLEWWRNVFEKANNILFEDKKSHRIWRPSFDWLIANDNNAVKVSEGIYDKPKDWRDKYNDNQTGVQKDS